MKSVSLNLYPEDATQFLRNCAPNGNTCQPPFDTCYTEIRPDGPSFAGYKELLCRGCNFILCLSQSTQCQSHSFISVCNVGDVSCGVRIEKCIEGGNKMGDIFRL